MRLNIGENKFPNNTRLPITRPINTFIKIRFVKISKCLPILNSASILNFQDLILDLSHPVLKLLRQWYGGSDGGKPPLHPPCWLRNAKRGTLRVGQRAPLSSTPPCLVGIRSTLRAHNSRLRFTSLRQCVRPRQGCTAHAMRSDNKQEFQND